jgi:hypothetical protein
MPKRMKRSKKMSKSRKPKWGVLVGQKGKQKLVPQIFTSRTAAVKEADLWSDAELLPCTTKS